MTVAELIEFLKTQPQYVLVAYSLYSDYSVMTFKEISMMELESARIDGYVSDRRSDKPTKQWLAFPGN